jgi:hypothetical protein
MILGQIANPQMADIAGALDIRQKRIDADEKKRRDIRVRQLVAEALPGLRDDSPLKRLAMEDTEKFAMITKVLGVPLNSGEKLQQLSDDVRMLNSLAKSDPRQAFYYAMSLQQERKEQGIESPMIDKFVDQIQTSEDPSQLIRGWDTLDRSLNGSSQDKPAGLVEFEGMTEGLSDDERQKARRIKLGLDPRAQGSADITIAEEGLTGKVAESKGQIAGTVKGSETTAKGNVNRAQDFINRGVAAAEGLPSVNRGIQLLELVETGGFDKAAIAAKQALGIESADEGELTYNLGKSVLTQLRETFGAAFTQEEGKRLADLEAGLSRSPATNKRILAQVKEIMTAKAKRGRQAAVDQGDDFTANDIDKFMSMDLSPKGGSGKGAMTPGITGATSKYKIEVMD